MVDEWKVPCELGQVTRTSGLRPGPIFDWRSQHLTAIDCDSTPTDFSCPKRSVPGRLQVLDSTCGKLMNRIAQNEMIVGKRLASRVIKRVVGLQAGFGENSAYNRQGFPRDPRPREKRTFLLCTIRAFSLCSYNQQKCVDLNFSAT
jgi:hypothetical protein